MKIVKNYEDMKFLSFADLQVESWYMDGKGDIFYVVREVGDKLHIEYFQIVSFIGTSQMKVLLLYPDDVKPKTILPINLTEITLNIS